MFSAPLKSFHNRVTILQSSLQVVVAIVAVFVAAMTLGESYQALSYVMPYIFGAATLHSVFVVTFFKEIIQKSFKKVSFQEYIPGFAVITGMVVIALVFGLSKNSGSIDWMQILRDVFIVPIEEELFFRVLITHLFGLFLLDSWLVGYSSVMIFILAHGQPTLVNLLSFQIPFPIGVFLLGSINQILYMRNSSIFPCLFFHMVCNASVPVFSFVNERIFDFLGFLYLK